MLVQALDVCVVKFLKTVTLPISNIMCSLNYGTPLEKGK